MGSGKTAVGRVLARRLGLPFADTDRIVARAAGMSVAAVFRRRGEPFFRKREARAVCRACSGPVRVVATGGGAVLDPGNIRAMRRAGTVVWLDAPFAELVRRVERQGPARRPLAEGRAPEARRRALRTLLAARVPLYRKAAHVVVPARGTPESVAARIERRLWAGKAV